MKKPPYKFKLGFPAFIFCLYLFLYVPITILLVFSFNDASFPAPWHGFTLKWYKELAHSSHLWNSFFTSLVVAVSATTLSALAGLLLVFCAAQGGRIGRYLSLYYANIIIPETVLGVGLLAFFAMLRIPLGLTTLIISHTVLGLGFVIPIVYQRFTELDPKLKEASQILGATEIQTFFKVTLPMLKPAFIVSGLLVFVLSFDDFILSYFCSGSDSQTLSLYILSMIRSGVSPVVNALSAILFLISSTLVFSYFSLSNKTRIF